MPALSYELNLAASTELLGRAGRLINAVLTVPR
jgi:hypothetical protein